MHGWQAMISDFRKGRSMPEESKAYRVVMAGLAEIRRQDADRKLISGSMDGHGRINISGEIDLPALCDAISIALEQEFAINADPD